MKDLILFYLQILLPVPVLVIAAKMDLSWSFLILLLLYVLVYRPLVDGYRLLRKGLIQENDIKKSFYKAPLWHIKYFKELYFE